MPRSCKPNSMVLKRELALDSDSYYSNPDYTRDADGKQARRTEKMIGDKQVRSSTQEARAELLLKQVFLGHR